MGMEPNTISTFCPFKFILIILISTLELENIYVNIL